MPRTLHDERALLRAGSTCTGLGTNSGWQLPRTEHAPRDACFALDSASACDFSPVGRLRRLGLDPRSLPVALASDPVPMTGEGVSMRSAVVAYRLLQLRYCDVRAHSRASILAARRRPQPSSCVVSVVTRLRFLHANGADGPRATRTGGPTPKPLFPREGLGDHGMNRAVHLDDTLRCRLPVALATWAERPSEGLALLGWLRGFPSSAFLVHPVVTGQPSARPGEPSRPSRNRSRPSIQSPSAKRSPKTRIRVHSIIGGPHEWAQIALRSRVGSVSPHAAPMEGALRTAPPPFPGEETSLGF